jgi:NH3-dependent NAD+ synthetase
VTGFKNDSIYCASKFALNGMAQSLAAEYKKHNIPIVPICPGYVCGRTTEQSIKNLVEHTKCSWDEAVAKIAARNPQGRILVSEEVAEACAFVAGGAAMAFSGEPMMLDGITDARILKIVNWIRQTAAPAKRLLIPISGGSDSALLLKLCAMAFPEGKTHAAHDGMASGLRGREWLWKLAPITYTQPSKKIWYQLTPEMDRWARFQAASHELEAWLVGSRNRTEDTLGTYSTPSRVASFLPLAGLWKSEVMELAKLVGVPQDILDSSRRADPDCGRPAEMAEIPLETIDLYLRWKEDPSLTDELEKVMTDAQHQYLIGVLNANRFKRNLPTRGPDLTNLK